MLLSQLRLLTRVYGTFTANLCKTEGGGGGGVLRNEGGVMSSEYGIGVIGDIARLMLEPSIHALEKFLSPHFLVSYFTVIFIPVLSFALTLLATFSKLVSDPMRVSPRF